MSVQPRDLVKRVATAVLTPIRFSVTTGHWRSSLLRKAVDRAGKPIPWLSYPANYFLQQLDFEGDDVLEFGGGQSTAWWSANARSVHTFEDDPDWLAHIRHLIRDRENVTIELVQTPQEMATRAVNHHADVVIIDGGDRLAVAKVTPDIVRDDGVVIFDNSDGYWTYDNSPEYPILDLFEKDGWLRIDFAGYAAASITPNVTSFFFRPNTKRLRHLPPPPCLPR